MDMMSFFNTSRENFSSSGKMAANKWPTGRNTKFFVKEFLAFPRCLGTVDDFTG